MKHILLALAALFLLYTFVAPKETPPPAVTGRVAEALASAPSADRVYVGRLYKALAYVTQRDNGQQINTTSIWRAVHRGMLRLAAANIKGKYPGLDVAVEETLAQHFSLDDLPLTPELVQKIVAGCKAVEAQCGR